MKQVVSSALSAKEDAADESDVLEAWISLGAANTHECIFLLPLTFAKEDLLTNLEVSRPPSSVAFYLNLNSPLTSANRCALFPAHFSLCLTCDFCSWNLLPTAKALTTKLSKLC